MARNNERINSVLAGATVVSIKTISCGMTSKYINSCITGGVVRAVDFEKSVSEKSKEPAILLRHTRSSENSLEL